MFDPSLIPGLVGTLRIALQLGADGLIALTVRNKDTLSQFLRTAGVFDVLLHGVLNHDIFDQSNHCPCMTSMCI